MDFDVTGVPRNPLSYVIYLWDALHKATCFNEFHTKTFFEAYTKNDAWMKTKSGRTRRWPGKETIASFSTIRPTIRVVRTTSFVRGRGSPKRY
jgi:hypothetical protein